MVGGLVTALGFALVGLLAPWPVDWLALGTLGVCAYWLETVEVKLPGGMRFTPAPAAYLAAALVPGVGVRAAAVLAVVAAVARTALARRSTLEALEEKLPLLIGFAFVVLVRRPGAEALAWVLGPAGYLAGVLLLEKSLRGRLDAVDRLPWVLARFTLRPLEVGLALAAPGVALVTTVYPWAGIFFVPVLGASRQAAESAVLTAQEKTTREALTALADARQSSLQAEQRLQESERAKRLLEGFSAHLARRPDPQETARALTATVAELLDVSSVAVFVSPDGGPPVPVSYQVHPDQQNQLQGAVLSGLREPLVDECWETREPRRLEQRFLTHPRLMEGDLVGVAYPLGTLGVLYAGRRQETPWAKGELQQLGWLSDKARLALEAAFQEHERRRAVEGMQKRLELLAVLMRGAQEMASSLDRAELTQRLLETLRRAIPHDRAWIVLQGEAPPPELAEAYPRVCAESRPLAVNGLLGAPLMSEEGALGAVFLTSASPFRPEQADLLFLLASQAGMAFANSRLYSEVVEARRQLEESQAQLVQSSKLTAIGQLAAGVAHELNTPLGAVSLALDATDMQLEEGQTTARRMLARAQEAVERCRSIIEKLLIYSRRSSAEFMVVDVNEVVRDTVEFLAHRLRSEGVEAVTRLQAGSRVRGRPQELQQVLINLVLNAVDALKNSADRRIEIATTSGDGRVTITVRDTGAGMDAEQLARIFEPFYTTKPIGEGTGLGLSVSHQIVVQHSGTLTADSTPGGGATFTIRLPAGS